MKRLHWEWPVCLTVGIALGLGYAWALAPAPLIGSAPGQLRADFKDAYRDAVASAYAVTGDLARARARLGLLNDPDAQEALVAQAQRALSSGQPFEHAQDLARLASDLQAGRSSVSAVQPSAPPAAEASATPRPTATLDQTSTAAVMTASPQALEPLPALTEVGTTPSPTRTPPPSPAAPFKQVGSKVVCDAALPTGLLQIIVLDRSGNPYPGIEITITWNGGEERFFTGLQPELGMGYADFVMAPDTLYAIQLARIGAPVTGIQSPACSGPGDTSYVGGLELTFQEP